MTLDSWLCRRQAAAENPTPISSRRTQAVALNGSTTVRPSSVPSSTIWYGEKILRSGWLVCGTPHSKPTTRATAANV